MQRGLYINELMIKFNQKLALNYFEQRRETIYFPKTKGNPYFLQRFLNFLFRIIVNEKILVEDIYTQECCLVFSYPVEWYIFFKYT